jgi:outer membrane protein insertion porin family
MKIFRDLTRIDDISIEPTVNPQRGVVGPAIVAKKQIFDRLTAVGQTFLSEGADGARALLQYDLTPTLTAVGSADSSVTEEATALGADLVYTVLSSQNTYLEFTMTGNSEVSKEEILKELRINSSSRIPFEDLNNVASAIESLYRERGYLDATVQISCQVSLGMCKEISAEILEGRLYRISSMAISGADLSSIVDVKKYTESFIDSTASKDQLLQARSQLIALLRNEGYIGARSSLTQTKDPSNPGALQLSIRVQPGRPVSFTFKGHSHFSESDFFKTIRLFTRTQPFGRNTIKILVENIERLYREAGYLFATIRYEEYIDELDGRQHYIVTIDEEQRVQVESVQFEGNVLLPTSRLKARVADLYSPDILTQLLTPDRVINEDIERNIGFIAQVYLDEGLQGTEIHYRIEQGSSSGLLKIVYIISEGQLVQVPWIALEGLPTGIVLPELSKQNHTVPALNKHLDLARTKLRDQGFFSAQYWSEYDAEADQIVFHFEPNEQTLISGIDIAGNANITTSEILKTLELQIGDPWNLQKIREAKVSLLRLGLFSRVNIGPADGTLDSTREGLFIEVVEKPLQTLRVGGGANSELGLHIFGDAVDKSLFKDGRSLSFLFDTYYDERKADISTGTASLRYIDPDFANRAVLFTEEVRFQRIDLSTFEFDLDRTSLSTLLFRRHNPRLTYSLGHTIFHEELDDVSPDAIISPLDSGQVDLSFLTANLNYDRRDNPLNPGLGYRVGFTSSLSSEGLASDANFAKAGIRGSMLLPFQLSQLPFSLALNGRTESGWTFYDTSAIPISQRFYLGGRTTVRGFRENSLGPKGSNGSVIGGDLLVQSNLELRHPIGENFSAHLFFDAGTTYLRDIGISSSDLRESTGFGFRYRSPIGPIGIDVGFPLDERPGEPSTRLHFSIGSIF